MPIDTLIDKQDTSEQVRARIAEILKTESVAQQALAVTAGEDPQLWELNVTEERANPWNTFIDDEAFVAPVINVWFDTDSFQQARGNAIKTQTAEGTFNVDCYGYGIASSDGAGGHNPGDRTAAFEAQRAARLCRNILMSSIYTYLGFYRGAGMLVEKRWLQSRTAFQPEQDNQGAQRVVAVRLAFAVTYNENAPQYVGQPLEYVHTEIKRDADGFLLAEADFDYTT